MISLDMYLLLLVILSTFLHCNRWVDLKAPPTCSCWWLYTAFLTLGHHYYRNLSCNHLNGPVPVEFGNLRSILIMWVSEENFLSWTKKIYFSYIVILWYTHLCVCSCSDMSLNKISGGIPEELGQLQNIVSL